MERESPAMSLAFKSFAISDLGLHRDGNEDAGLTSATLVAVADGMGGHAGGEVASKIAIMALQERQNNVAKSDEILLDITTVIDQTISEKSKALPELSGMGTTLTELHLIGESVELLHVGDSRCYAFSGGKLTQLSYDHTVMQELIDQGRLTPSEAINHPQRSLLTQALMGDSGIETVLKEFPVKIGDQFLLCSDGLSSVLSDLEISKILKKHSGQELVETLVEEVKAKGAPDNVTIIVVEVIAQDAASNPQLDAQLIGAANV
jgi:PPM family protein phosphatase